VSTTEARIKANTLPIDRRFLMLITYSAETTGWLEAEAEAKHPYITLYTVSKYL